jgi:hypothetical protein
VSIRRTLELDQPPAKILAALATTGENLEYTVRRADPSLGVIVMTSPVTREALSAGYIATGRVQRGSRKTVVEVDVTPRVGFWALQGSAEQAEELVDELRAVLKAPKARIRRPEQAGRPNRPFGYRPEVAAGLWATSSLLVFGLLAGGRWWIAALAGLLGSLLLLRPYRHRIWTIAVALAALLSFPLGLLGLAVRREALAQAYWQAAKQEH